MTVEVGPRRHGVTLQERCARQITQAGFAYVTADKPDWKGTVNPYYEEQIAQGAALSAAAAYVEATNGLRQIQSQIGAFFEDYDLLLSPVSGSPAWGAEEPVKPFFNIFHRLREQRRRAGHRAIPSDALSITMARPSTRRSAYFGSICAFLGLRRNLSAEALAPAVAGAVRSTGSPALFPSFIYLCHH